jgi:hypothetical protein
VQDDFNLLVARENVHDGCPDVLWEQPDLNAGNIAVNPLHCALRS